MSGSFESVRWNACVHRLYLSSYSERSGGFFVVDFFRGGGGEGWSPKSC